MAPKPPKYVEWDNPDAYEPVRPWTSGNVFLDWISGIGGIPMGRVIETYGPESSGKSTLALMVAAHVWHTQGIPSVYWDAEDAFDPSYAISLGHSAASLKLVDRNECETLEDFFEQTFASLDPKNFAKSPFALVIVDSVASVRCRTELAKNEADLRTIGMEKARLWSDNLRIFTKLLADTGASLVLVNQLRDAIDLSGAFVPPGMAAMMPKTRTPGGKGIKFYCSLRIEYTVSSEIKEPRYNPVTKETENTVVGKHIWMKVTKNKVAPPPWRKIRVQIRDGLGFDLAQNLLDFAQVHDLLGRNAGVWTFPGALFGWPEDFIVKGTDGFSGDSIAAHLVRSRPDIAATLTARVVEILGASTDYVADRPPLPDPEDLEPLIPELPEPQETPAP